MANKEEAQKRIKVLLARIRKIAAELENLGGDLVWDFNDVWGDAGPDCCTVQ